MSSVHVGSANMRDSFAAACRAQCSACSRRTSTAATLAPENHGVLTTEYSIHLLRPARGQELRCVARVLRPGRTLSVVESEVFADGTLVAKLTATLAIVAAQG